MLGQQIQQVYHHVFADVAVDTAPLGEVFHVTTGRTPHSSGDLPWFATKDLDAPYLFHPSRYVDRSMHQKLQVPENTVLLCYKLTRMGSLAITTEPCFISEAIAAFRTEKKILKPYLYCFLKEYPYRSLGSNSGFGDSIGLRTLRSLEIPLPPDTQLQAFYETVQPFFEEMHTLLRENYHAEQTIDRFMKLL